MYNKMFKIKKNKKSSKKLLTLGKHFVILISRCAKSVALTYKLSSVKK